MPRKLSRRAKATATRFGLKECSAERARNPSEETKVSIWYTTLYHMIYYNRTWYATRTYDIVQLEALIIDPRIPGMDQIIRDAQSLSADGFRAACRCQD